MSPHRGRVCFEKSNYVIHEPYPGLHLVYHAKKFLFSGRSKFQRIDIIENDAYGRTLFLNGNVQHTAYDSRLFNEALCRPAKRNSVANIIILGGGSGQTLLSILESPAIERVTVAEIDSLVVQCCRKYIAGVDRAFKDSRVTLVVGDAFKHLNSTTRKFDAAIIDLTEDAFGFGKEQAILIQMYSNIKEKCKGCCSQYIGSSVPLAYGPRLRRLVREVSRQFLTRVRFEETFIPSFGAPHAFMHAGYERL